MLHGHGDDGYKYKQAIVANFSTNVWYGGQSEDLKNHLISNWDIIDSYPEASAESLIDLIAKDLKVDQEMLIATNGATEAFYLIAQCFKNQSSTIVIPTFSEYEDACRVNNHELFFTNWSDLTATTKFHTRLVWICNPNNPTGSILDPISLESLLDLNQNSTFIVDEAYIDFTDQITSSIDLIKKHKNLIIVKSLTKNFAIPGLRLGYLVSNKEMVQDIEFYKPPWTVNSLAIEAGKYLIEHKSKILPPVNYYKSASKKLQENLNKITGLKIHASKTSYFLIELEEISSFELKNYLISEFGILVRDASNFRGLNSSYIRIATLNEEKNQLLIDALKTWSNLNS
ncbi:aminotransferase class I/II-fold pyridoxal phosphate-dependent enzyme [Marinifilum sp. N1E240]|uniref:pyridoxal phosphate-dependent aminotransferase n=1 Tax=Marinifilum sp. N1E240 TaxID=2608082 RepID=UPI00128DC007|nr:aminotransferase class I/II-fold pyridoxal phosphate-dependent enzyme [Marinifilum sp. N1E240]MPQ47065.1 aminotransferase class I/II-fold pyridoxal phosphate-dependent enzyme [Marinifilum sp. N1E240]